MSKNNTTTVAYPYARAIFNIASSNNQLDAWSDCLINAKELLKNENFTQLLSSPRSDNLFDLVMSCVANPPKHFDDFIRVLVLAKRLPIIDQICDLFLLQHAISISRINAYVESVVPLNDLDIEAVKKKIANHFQKKHVDIVNTINPALIGGLKITVDDWVLDLSVKHSLERFSVLCLK